MTREVMLALLERRLSSWHARNPEALAVQFMEIAVLDSAMMGQPVERAAIRRAYEAFFEAYGELSIDREHVLWTQSEDVTTATRLLRNLARRLDQEHPGAAANVREGLEETVTVLTLGLSPRL
jgi:hypothetical protein